MARPEDDRELWLRWLTDAAAEVGVNVEDIPIDELLDLASAVADDVARPMAPVTAFVAGLAAGKGGNGADSANALIGLAKAWKDA